MTQTELAHALQWADHAQYVSSIERGQKSIPVKSMVALGRVTNTSVNIIIRAHVYDMKKTLRLRLGLE